MTSHFINYFARRSETFQTVLHHRRNPAATTTAAEKEGTDGASPAATPHSPGELAGESPVPDEWCAFCSIISGEEPAHKVYEDEHAIAFLDILPIREGHLLVVPKLHYPRVTDLPDEVSACLGRVMPKIARALCAAVDQPDFNIISNQGYAQIVHHLHYHLVPAPRLNALTYTEKKSGWASIVGREELDEQEGEELAKKIREELAKETKLGKAKL